MTDSPQPLDLAEEVFRRAFKALEGRIPDRLERDLRELLSSSGDAKQIATAVSTHVDRATDAD